MNRICPLAAIALPLLVGFGCARNAEVQVTREVVEQYAALPGLAATHHVGLREELARIRAEGATPLQLDSSSETTPVSSASRFENVDWSKFFRPDSVKMVAGRVDSVYPPQALRLSPAELTAAIHLREQYVEQLQRFQRLTSAADFYPGWTISHGLAADTTFVEVARICARLEGLTAAMALNRDQIDPALEAVERMLDAAQLLAAQRHVVARMTAVQVRQDALAALAAIVAHPECTDRGRRRAMNRIAADLASWPQDQQTWIGDRAQGLFVYEMVRDGRFLSILTEDEKVKFRRTHTLDELDDAVLSNLDADQMFYLSAMRRIIDASDEPFHQRTRTLDGVRGDLLALYESPQYPMVADVILLADFEIGHRRQAVDRARMEAWLLALQAANGATPAAIPINPLTGAPYDVTREGEEIVVEGIDPQTDESVRIPHSSAS